MARQNLILDRYEPIGTAGAGGFGTVRIAWDPRIQRKVAIKTILLTELDAYRANLPGANATRTSMVQADAEANAEPQAEAGAASSSPTALQSPTADRWHGVLPWEEFLAQDDAAAAAEPESSGSVPPYLQADDIADREDAPGPDPITSLAHLPGLDEARTAAMLDDPRIVTVYDFEIRDRTAYLIMEYVEGITLTRLLSDYADDITLGMVTAVFDAVAGALMTAHEAGVLHLDIKPDNIIITPQGQAKVTDFGLATLADASGAGTTGGGTIGYMPLEQMRREHLDARTDEWSLASLTYEMMTGDNPFRARNLEEAEQAIENAELVLPSLCWRTVDSQVDDVLFYALDPDREERYASVADFAEEMDKFLGDAEEGKEHLAWAVSDALGLLEEDDEEEYPAEDEPDEGATPRRSAGPGRLASARTALSSIFAHATSKPDDAGEDADPDGWEYGQDEYYDDDFPDEPPARQRRERKEHTPLSERTSDRIVAFAARLFGAGTSAALAVLAMVNMPFLDELGLARFAIAGAVAAACAVAAVIVPHIGALAGFCLLSVAIALCGHPVVGAVLLVATVAWWYTVGHEGVAQANTALAMPLVGGMGGASAVPIVSGGALEPVHAAATTAYTALVALVLASFGEGTLLGWNALAYWHFAEVDVTGNIVALLTTPATWAIIASWIAASAVFAFLHVGNKRAASLLGLALAVAFVLAGTIVFVGPSPQLLISVAAAAAAFIALLV